MRPHRTSHSQVIAVIDATRPDYSNTPVSRQRPTFGYTLADACEPCVSIVTPFFNTGAVFLETVESVRRQSLQQWEWIIVNDGSTNAESLTNLDRIRDSDPRIRVIDLPENRGPGAARNTGYAAARTNYVLQLDSDDLIEPTYVEKCWWHLHSEPDCGFVNALTVNFGARHGIGADGLGLGREVLRRNVVNGNVLVRRSVFHAAGGYDEQIRHGLEDWDFWVRCANAGYWGHTIAEPLIWYRWRENHGARWPDWDRGVRERTFQTRLRERYPELWRGPHPVVGTAPWTPDDALPEAWPGPNTLAKHKRRLLLIVPWYALGGSDQFNIDLVQQLVGHGWEVTVASTLFHDDPWLSRFTALTPDVFALPRFLAPADYPRFLAYLIHSRQVETVLLSNSEFAYGALPYLRRRCPEVSFVDFLHAVDAMWHDGGYPAMSVKHQQHLDLTAVSSRALKDWMTKRGADPERVEVCYTNIDTDAISPAKTREHSRTGRGVAADVPVILFAGRICAQKQPLVLADTLKHLRRRGHEFEAWIVGDGPDMRLLRSAITGSSLRSSVQLKGALPHEQVLELMSTADVFFLPSKYEGIALTLFEAMASGLPVVSVDTTGQRELVTEECGVLIQSSEPRTEAAEYAAILGDLLTSPGRRHAMGSAARARVVREFGIDRMGARMIEILDRAQARHRSSQAAAINQREALEQARTAVRHAMAQELYLRLQATRDTRMPLKVRTHGYLSRWFAPVHDMAVRKGWTWIPRAGWSVRRIMLGRELNSD